MPRACTVCTHPQREEINKALVRNEKFRYVAERYGLSTTALHRHKAEHMPVALVKAQEAADVAEADDLLSQVRYLQGKAMSILGKAEAAGDLRTALGAIREARGNLELLAKLMGELSDAPTVNVLLSPEWVTVQGIIIRALEPHDEARQAVVAALAGVQNGHR